jgi:hypothetical protein
VLSARLPAHQCYAEFEMDGQQGSGAVFSACAFGPAMQHCAFMDGDGTGGADKLLGKVTTDRECLVRVQSDEPHANGATMAKATDSWGRHECFAEFDMTGTATDTERSTKLRTCAFR